MIDSSGAGPAGIAVRGLSRSRLDALRRDPAALTVRVIDALTHAPLATPVAGHAWLDGETAHFRPAYPLAEGASYAVAIGPTATMDMALLLRVPAHAHPAPHVESVYPSAHVVPENLLKFYVRFSTPMRHGFADTHVALLDEAGHAMRAFLRRDVELWDSEDRTITMFLDPARVKTGLRANARLGRALRAGHRYRLTVLPGWPNADGVPLERAYVKAFRAAREDRAPLNERDWAISVPHVDSREALTLRFGEPLDRLLLGQAIAVVDDHGTPVPGAASVAATECEWRFVPNRPWRARDAIVVDASLEDLAGNDLRESFDRPVAERRRGRDAIRILVARPTTIDRIRPRIGDEPNAECGGPG
ncbi:MAG: Ig-like domain-containing protein [Gemmatimonadaceae bacterium]